LFSAETRNGQTTVQGSLVAAPFTDYRVEFFSSPTADASGHGEGKTFLGAVQVSGTFIPTLKLFTFTAPFAVPAGQIVTATATAIGGSTSEFAANVTVVDRDVVKPKPTPLVVAAAQRLRVRVRAGKHRYRLTLANLGDGAHQGPLVVVFDGLG